MIDLWDINTYAEDVRDYLGRSKEIVTRYLDREIELNEIKPPQDPRERIRFKMPSNAHYEEYRAAVDALGPILSSKTFRAFHYSRMTDDEVDAFKTVGIVTTSVDFLRQRVDHQVNSGTMSVAQANRIVKNTALARPEEFGHRDGFWTTATPIHPADEAVNFLVDHWGGESAYWAFQTGSDGDTLDLLKGIGKGRIIEIAVPLSAVNCGDTGAGTASNAFDEFALTLGYDRYPRNLDLHLNQPLPASAILQVHTEGEEDFGKWGEGYPASFVLREEE